MDRTRGFFFAVAYRSNLLNPKEMRWVETRRQSDARGGNDPKRVEIFKNIVVVDEPLIINGLQWRHVVEDLVWAEGAGHHKFGLRQRKERFDYQVDATHLLRKAARYEAEVIADPAWYAARSGLLKKLVQSTRIETLSPADVKAAWAQFQRAEEEWDAIRAEGLRKAGLPPRVTAPCGEEC